MDKTTGNRRTKVYSNRWVTEKVTGVWQRPKILVKLPILFDLNSILDKYYGFVALLHKLLVRIIVPYPPELKDYQISKPISTHVI